MGYRYNGEETLVQNIIGGDEYAMRELYDKYVRALSSLCRRYIPDEDEVKDVLQETFIKVFGSIRTFEYRGKGSLEAWISRIATNEALRHLRDKTRRKEFVPSQDLPDLPDDDEEPPDINKVPQEVLLEVIRGLPDGYRTVFNLFVFEQLSHKDIAVRLGISESSSASQYHRAKKAIAKRINEYIKLNNCNG